MADLSDDNKANGEEIHSLELNQLHGSNSFNELLSREKDNLLTELNELSRRRIELRDPSKRFIYFLKTNIFPISSFILSFSLLLYTVTSLDGKVNQIEIEVSKLNQANSDSLKSFEDIKDGLEALSGQLINLYSGIDEKRVEMFRMSNSTLNKIMEAQTTLNSSISSLYNESTTKANMDFQSKLSEIKRLHQTLILSLENLSSSSVDEVKNVANMSRFEIALSEQRIKENISKVVNESEHSLRFELDKIKDEITKFDLSNMTFSQKIQSAMTPKVILSELKKISVFYGRHNIHTITARGLLFLQIMGICKTTGSFDNKISFLITRDEDPFASGSLDTLSTNSLNSGDSPHTSATVTIYNPVNRTIRFAVDCPTTSCDYSTGNGFIFVSALLISSL